MLLGGFRFKCIRRKSFVGKEAPARLSAAFFSSHLLLVYLEPLTVMITGLTHFLLHHLLPSCETEKNPVL